MHERRPTGNNAASTWNLSHIGRCKSKSECSQRQFCRHYLVSDAKSRLIPLHMSTIRDCCMRSMYKVSKSDVTQSLLLADCHGIVISIYNLPVHMYNTDAKLQI